MWVGHKMSKAIRSIINDTLLPMWLVFITSISIGVDGYCINRWCKLSSPQKVLRNSSNSFHNVECIHLVYVPHWKTVNFRTENKSIMVTDAEPLFIHVVFRELPSSSFKIKFQYPWNQAVKSHQRYAYWLIKNIQKLLKISLTIVNLRVYIPFSFPFHASQYSPMTEIHQKHAFWPLWARLAGYRFAVLTYIFFSFCPLK